MLKDTLVSSGAIKFGKYTTTAGKETDYYIDIKKAVTDPRVLKEISKGLSEYISAKKIAGVELGSVPLLAAISLRLEIPYVILRKEERSHGTKDILIGDVTLGERIDIIEDVVTTGGSVSKAATVLRERGAKVDKVITVVDREDGGSKLLHSIGVELISLLRASELNP